MSLRLNRGKQLPSIAETRVSTNKKKILFFSDDHYSTNDVKLYLLIQRASQIPIIRQVPISTNDKPNSISQKATNYFILLIFNLSKREHFLFPSSLSTTTKLTRMRNLGSISPTFYEHL